MKILVINPGSTSTKLAVYENENPIWRESIAHPSKELAGFHHINEQYEYRRKCVHDTLEKAGIPLVFDAVIARGGLLKPTPKELAGFHHINEQYEYRRKCVHDTLEKAGIPLVFDAVIARGGLLKPTLGGVYQINERIKHDLWHADMEHASNLAAWIADEIAHCAGCPSYLADPVVTDELRDLARISGIPELPRISIFHALNSRAVSRSYAARIGRKYEELNLIVAHLGGGISVSAHHYGKVVDVNNALNGEGPFSPERAGGRKYEELNLIVAHLGGGISVSAHHYGKVVDVNNALNGEGPFSPERAGTLPARQLVDMCFSGKYTYAEIRKMINGRGGLVAHLGTTDVQSIIRWAHAGAEKHKLVLEGTTDVQSIIRWAHAGAEKHKLVLDAMLYTVAKQVGAMHIALHGQTDAVILTGGIAFNDYCIQGLREWLEGLAPIVVIPGEDEMGALAMNALGVLRGELTLQEYAPETSSD